MGITHFPPSIDQIYSTLLSVNGADNGEKITNLQKTSDFDKLIQKFCFVLNSVIDFTCSNFIIHFSFSFQIVTIFLFSFVQAFFKWNGMENTKTKILLPQYFNPTIWFWTLKLYFKRLLRTNFQWIFFYFFFFFDCANSVFIGVRTFFLYKCACVCMLLWLLFFFSPRLLPLKR